MRQPRSKLSDPTGRKKPATAAEPTVSKPGEKPGVLVVDDEHIVRIMVQLGLERNGFDVWLARNGREAIDLYRRHAEEIAVVLLDVCMPGLDGLETLEVLRELNPEVLACFMSSETGALPAGRAASARRRVMSSPSRSDWTTWRASSGCWRIACPPIFARPAGYADGEPGKKPYRGAGRCPRSLS